MSPLEPGSLSGAVLVVDNYDSFTFNLVQYLEELGATTAVRRNDVVTVDEITAARPAGIVISPGPRTPSEAGICLELVTRLAATTPILGVCLGHQAIGQAMGGRVVRAPRVMHGKVSLIHHTAQGVLAGLAQPFEATRYHSLVVERESLPLGLEVTAWTDDGLVMGLRHRELPLEGVQFHPESIRTGCGHALLANFLRALGVSLAEAATA